MADLPWEVVDKRFGKFLDFGYVIMVVSGAAIFIEVAALVLTGSPDERRDELSTMSDRLHWDQLNLVGQVLLCLVGALAAYCIGRLALSLWHGVAWRLQFLRVRSFVKLMNLREARRHRRRHGLHLDEMPPEGGAKTTVVDVLLSGGIWVLKRPLDSSTESSQESQFWLPWRAPVAKFSQVWDSVCRTHGEAAVRSLFAQHGLLVSESQPSTSLAASTGYADAWLQRNRPALRFPYLANRSILFEAAVVPLLLAPATVGVLTSLKISGFVAIVLGALLSVVAWGEVRRSSVLLTINVVQQFITFAFVENASRDASSSGG